MKTDLEIFVDNSILVGDLSQEGRQRAIDQLKPRKDEKQWVPVFKSMQEYADQEMIAFAEWVNSAMCYLPVFGKYSEKKHKRAIMYRLNNGTPSSSEPMPLYTMQHLLTKYKEECKSK